MTLKYLLRKEFTQIRRNSFLPRLIIIYPIVIMCVMPWIMNMEVKNIAVDVVDNDRSTQSQQLVHEIEANKYFVFHGQQPTYAAALKNIEHSEADIAKLQPRPYLGTYATGAYCCQCRQWDKGGHRLGLSFSSCFCQCVTLCRSHSVEGGYAVPLQ